MPDTSTSAVDPTLENPGRDHPGLDDPTEERPAVTDTGSGRTSRLISASALMAGGTLVSRLLGFARLSLLAFLFGNATRQADMFTVANTVPNSMYILLAGGVLNTVLVPQIVRAIKGDPDGGTAYTNRIMTAGLLALGLITVVLTLAVPLVIDLYSADGWKSPALSSQYHSMVVLGYYCMPQVFFYGVHVLAGQVLNARERFGPMMWAPIANNVISLAVLGIFLVVFQRTDPGRAFTSGQELLLGLGSTLGIVAQAAVLVPFLRRAGYRFQPRFDFRHTGLGKTFGLAKWTLGYVLVTQVALVVVSKLATGATVRGEGAGLLVYSNAYAVWILPHSLITLSLATAMLPAASAMAATGDLDGVARETMRSLRLALTALLPASVAFLTLGVPIARVLFGFGRGGEDVAYVGWALMALGVGLVPFTIQYVCLRAFYALEDTRTPFFLQVVIAGANVLLGLAAVAIVDRPTLVAAALGLAYSLAYVVGIGLSFARLRRRLPALDAVELLEHCVRLLVAVTPAAVVAVLINWLLVRGLAGPGGDSQLGRAVALAVAGIAAVVLFLVAARLLRVTEVSAIIATVSRRGGSGGGGGAPHDSATSGGSTPAEPPAPPTIEPPITAGPATQPPTGTNENADRMTSAAMTRTDLRRELNGTDPAGEADLGDASPNAADRVTAPVTRAASLPAGTVLGTRYRLEELLAVSEPAITWRAFDQVLSRSVLVHLLPPGDEAEPDLMAAARRASVATDSRFLRVLDAVPQPRTEDQRAASGDDPDLGSYIVCEYATGQSLESILTHGPLSALEAGWVVREVADALSGVHSLGLHHRRISPETVIITPTGDVKIVGLLIEATLRPARASRAASARLQQAAHDPELLDVLDLGRLLYAALVCRWPGGPAYSLPDAPMVGRHWMSPRQVRAGVSPALDNICDQLLGDQPRHRASPITTANALVDALTKVLGAADASGDLERRLRQPIPKVGAATNRTSGPVSTLLDQPTELTPVVLDDRPGDTAVRSYGLAGPHTPAADAAPLRISRPVTDGGPSETGLSGAGAVGAGAIGAGATGAAGTTVVRAPVPSQPAPHRVRPPHPPRRWIAVLVMLIVLLTGVGLVAALVLDNQLSAAPDPGPQATPARSTTSRATTAPPASTTVPIVAARDFDPQGADDKRENPDEVGRAYDGDPATRWRTVAYIGNPKLGGLKRGVGLVLDLGSAQPVSSVTVTLSGDGTDAELRVPEDDPATTTKAPLSSDSQWRVVAKQSDAGRTAALVPKAPVNTRFVLVYLTSLPKEDERYRGGISEVVVRR
ncbi:murein biosynthesis integral membrane protein MurJ [uncultured Friedmanniella sp.]|uniref:murein biosynthesis integral membrane protein MurJ n=1 Tax=uncultured Friedmanniella sp. TaxID=335381 RepID=UPI0035C9A08A